MRLIVASLFLMLMLAGCADESPAASVDSDGDGYTDDEERDAGSDPLNATSVPVVLADGNGTVWPAWGDLATATIRPGSSLGGYCTFNFLFESPNGTGYIGTAAHCTDGVGERLMLPGVGEIATVVYDSDDDGSIVDFTLARLDDDRIAQAHPKMLDHEGPTGAITLADLAVGDLVHIHGYGMVFGDAEETQSRSGVLMDWSEEEFVINMPAVPGDSGSSILHDSGKALGIISRFNLNDTPPSTDTGPLMPFIFEELAKAGYGDVRLATI